MKRQTTGLRNGLGYRGFWSLIPLFIIVTAGVVILVLWATTKNGQQGSKKEEWLFEKIKSGDVISRWATDPGVLKFESDLNTLKANSGILDLDESRLTFPMLDPNVTFEM